MVLCVLTGWLDRREREAVAYLIEENRLLRRQLGTRRLRLTDGSSTAGCTGAPCGPCGLAGDRDNRDARYATAVAPPAHRAEVGLRPKAPSSRCPAGDSTARRAD